MNVAPRIPRRAASPHARKLAREMAVHLDDLVGSGPNGRIVASDVMAWKAPLDRVEPEPQSPEPTRVPFTFAAAVSLVDLRRLAGEAAVLGFAIEVEDAALRAAVVAFAGVSGATGAGVSLEAGGRQILVRTASGISIGAERRLRQDALERGADASAEPALASLRVIRSDRVVPVSVPPLSGRSMRLVLVVDGAMDRGNAILCADSEAVTEEQAQELLEAFVLALEEPLALLA